MGKGIPYIQHAVMIVEPVFVSALLAAIMNFDFFSFFTFFSQHAVESSRVRGLLSTLARAVPTHSILAVSEACYGDLVGTGGEAGAEAEAVAALMAVVSENVSSLDKAQVKS